MPANNMTADDIASFLGERHFVSVASLRKDGSPNVVPLGYFFDGEYVYLTSAQNKKLASRLKRDPRMCVTVYNTERPVRYLIAHGKAEFVEDPEDRISREIHRKYSHDAPGINYEENERLWLGRGRILIRMKLENPITMDESKLADYAY